MTTAGSLALVGPAPPRDAFIVERLRAAGAVMLGKTNLSEWANFRSTQVVERLERARRSGAEPLRARSQPCGSSSGTGAAIAANLAAVGVGTETDGSIVCPSAANGLVGIKPTVGLVSRTGIMPISHTQDTPGPMARTVADAAIAAGGDGRRRSARCGDGGQRTPVRRRTTRPGSIAEALKGARIGVLRGPLRWLQPGRRSGVDAAIARDEVTRRRVIDPVELPNAGEYDDSEFEVLLYEFKADLNAYLAARPRAAGQDAGRSDRVQREEPRHARCRTSARSCSSHARRKAR